MYLMYTTKTSNIACFGLNPRCTPATIKMILAYCLCIAWSCFHIYSIYVCTFYEYLYCTKYISVFHNTYLLFFKRLCWKHFFYLNLQVVVPWLRLCFPETGYFETPCRWFFFSYKIRNTFISKWVSESVS